MGKGSIWNINDRGCFGYSYFLNWTLWLHSPTRHCSSQTPLPSAHHYHDSGRHWASPTPHPNKKAAGAQKVNWPAQSRTANKWEPGHNQAAWPHHLSASALLQRERAKEDWRRLIRVEFTIHSADFHTTWEKQQTTYPMGTKKTKKTKNGVCNPRKS